MLSCSIHLECGSSICLVCPCHACLLPVTWKHLHHVMLPARLSSTCPTTYRIDPLVYSIHTVHAPCLLVCHIHAVLASTCQSLSSLGHEIRCDWIKSCLSGRLMLRYDAQVINTSQFGLTGTVPPPILPGRKHKHSALREIAESRLS